MECAEKQKSKCKDYSGELPVKMGSDFDQLAALVGQFMEYWGFKKIHGQIWTHIYLSECPICATTIVKRLKVSKALVSLAIKDLVQYKVIQACEKGQKRTIYFKSNPEIMNVITLVLQHRERIMLDEIKESINKLKTKKIDHVPKDQLNDLENMVLDASDFLDVMIHSQLQVSAVPKQ